VAAIYTTGGGIQTMGDPWKTFSYNLIPSGCIRRQSLKSASVMVSKNAEFDIEFKTVGKIVNKFT
jgi:hypothetical protein